MIFCGLDLLVTLPLVIYNFALTMVQWGGKLFPDWQWDEVHYGFGTVLQITAEELSEESRSLFDRYQLIRWAAPISALLFVALFCFSAEALREYKRAFEKVKTKLSTKKQPPFRRSM